MSEANLSQTLVFGHLWQSIALAAVLACVLLVGRRMRGSTRYGLGVAAFVASLALPLAAFIPGETIIAGLLKQLDAPVKMEAAAPVGTAATVTVTPVAPAAPLVSSAMLDDVTIAPAATPIMAVAPATPLAVTPVVRDAAKPPAPLFTLPEIKLPDITLPVLAVWLAGVLFLLARTLRDLIAVERLVARARPADLPEALKRRFADVRIAISDEAPGPMAAGLFRPCIVLPESLALGSPGMAALLEHEHAHIRRRDMLAALGQRIVLALLWWSPALYWISRRMDEEREVACDEAAVDRTGDAKAFARSLTKQAENQLWARAPKLAVGAIGPRSQFGRRIRRLIDLAKTGGAPAKYSGRLAFAGLALAVGVAAMVTPRFTADAQQPGAQPPSSDTPVDRSTPQGRARADRDRQELDGGRSGDDRDFHFNFDSDGDFAQLHDEIRKLMESVNDEVRASMKDMSPELQAELQGLTAEMSALGLDISQSVTSEVMSQMPSIMAEVQRALDEAGFKNGDWRNGKGLSEEQQEEIRAAMEDAHEQMEQAREQMKEAFGPEMQAEVRRAVAEAREEVAAHREEIAAAMKESQAGMAIAREALAAASKEIAAARARGDFDFKGKDGIKLDFDFDVEKEVLDKLRKAGIDVDGKGPRGQIHINFDDDEKAPGAQLFRAAGRCQTDVVSKLVIDSKADVNRVLPGDGTALIAAARAGCLEAVRTLINAGADVNLASRGDGNPLIAAAQRGRIDVVKLLLDRGATVNAGVGGDGNALIAAAGAGRLEMAKLLVERGADVNAYVEGDETPLMSAAEQGKLDVVKFLVERGAKVNLTYNVKMYGGKTEVRSPLSQAEKHHNEDVAAYLRSKGAVTNAKPAN